MKKTILFTAFLFVFGFVLIDKVLCDFVPIHFRHGSIEHVGGEALNLWQGLFVLALDGVSQLADTIVGIVRALAYVLALVTPLVV